MSTKGASYRYGNTRGSKHQGLPTKRISYPRAKDFNRGGIDTHFNRHKGEFNSNSKQDYASKAIHFANDVDRQHYKSVVDYKKTTYKYDPRDGRLVIVTKDGYVTSFYKANKGFYYYPEKGKRVWQAI